MINCKDCQRALTFDEWHISKKGNKIPLDAETFESAPLSRIVKRMAFDAPFDMQTVW